MRSLETMPTRRTRLLLWPLRAVIGITEGACSATEFTTADDELPVCQDFVDDTWNADFLAEVGTRDKAACLDEGQQEDEEDEEDEEEGVSTKSPQPKLTTFRVAMQSLDVAAFLDNKGCTYEATQVCYTRDLVAALSYSTTNTRQTTMDDFFIDYDFMLYNIIMSATDCV